MRAGARQHPGYWAFVVHRASGLGLALFLPVHFWVLSQAIEGAAALDAALVWTDGAAFKIGEVILVALLSAHLAGGLRLLALEFLPWSQRQGIWIGLTFAAALFAGLIFLLGVVPG